jgi:hypothetical protein
MSDDEHLKIFYIYLDERPRIKLKKLRNFKYEAYCGGVVGLRVNMICLGAEISPLLIILIRI